MKAHKSTGRRYIICVDDDRALLDGLVHQLEGAFSASHEIEGAESAQEAIELVEELFQGDDVVELVISDQVMPGMKGDQLLEYLHGQYPEMLAMILTGQGGLDSAIRSINNANLNKYLLKPWNEDDLILTIRDLLEKYTLEQENKRLFQELKEAYRHLKEAQEQLVRSEKFAVVGKLAAGIAHEIRNQLTVLGYAEVIKMSFPENKQIGQYVQNILEARSRIISIIEEIRQFARNQTQSYEKEVCLLTDVIDTALSIMSYDKEAKKRTIVKDFQVFPVLTINRDKIIQVLLNLVRNAVQATTAEEGQITIAVSENQNRTLIDITDNGCGIAPEHLDTIWQPFFTTKGEEGTGLGLDICRRIIEGHHGRLLCRSEVDAGTTFTIELPLDKKESAISSRV